MRDNGRLIDGVPAMNPVVIEDVRPRTPGGERPPKASTGESVRVSATAFRDGHNRLSVACRVRDPQGLTRMMPLGPDGGDRWSGRLDVAQCGVHEFAVLAWTDRFGSWCRDLVKRADAGQPLAVEFLVGAEILESLSASESASSDDRLAMAEAAATLASPTCADQVKMAAATDPALVALCAVIPDSRDLSYSEPHELQVERARASFGAWYELFPRSFGGFEGVAKQVGRLAALGFDVLYLPPIHPIGVTARKGPNNSLVAGPGDPGSPWAIGGPTGDGTPGGHTAIHPGLGTIEDFDLLVTEARSRDMEIALDFALQCSPDHPWVSDHPAWFRQLPDGSIRTAENPPKRYEDIHPIEFWPREEADREELWAACHQILEYWIGHGVTIFRVDNPHTKPVAFWAWLIDMVQAEHPEVIFLAEAFTDPGMMTKLAEVGFTQSYTYFTWRHSRDEIETYVRELAHGDHVDFMRPNFWPNTPDLLEGVLRDGARAAFLLRVTLAATLVGNYGIYSGYELCENTPASRDNTEYQDSEKYQLVERDWGASTSIAPYIGELNHIRRRNPAFGHLRTVAFHRGDNPNLIVYSRRDPDHTNVVLVVVNLDPNEAQSGLLDLDLDELGVAPDHPWQVFDELSGETYTWEDHRPWVRLDPAADQVAHILRIR